QLAKRETCGGIEQDVAERVAAAATHCAEPRVGELPGREHVIGAAHLQVAFDAEYPRPVLKVVAGLHAGGEAGRLGPVAGDTAPVITESAAEIEADPAIAVERRDHGVGGWRVRNWRWWWRRWWIGIIGRTCLADAAGGEQNQCTQNQPLHAN